MTYKFKIEDTDILWHDAMALKFPIPIEVDMPCILPCDVCPTLAKQVYMALASYYGITPVTDGDVDTYISLIRQMGIDRHWEYIDC